MLPDFGCVIIVACWLLTIKYLHSPLNILHVHGVRVTRDKTTNDWIRFGHFENANSNIFSMALYFVSKKEKSRINHYRWRDRESLVVLARLVGCLRPSIYQSWSARRILLKRISWKLQRPDSCASHAHRRKCIRALWTLDSRRQAKHLFRSYIRVS